MKKILHLILDLCILFSLLIILKDNTGHANENYMDAEYSSNDSDSLIDVPASDPLKQKVVRQGDSVFISFRYRENIDLHLEIGRGGINNIIGIKAIYLDPGCEDEVSPWISDRAVLLMKACTDWISPYEVKLKGYKDSSSIFTGGWHGSNGNDTGLPTAKTDNIRVTVNGEDIQDNAVYEGNVNIMVENYIKAYNSILQDIYVLKEAVDYNINSRKVNIKVYTTAVKPVTLYTYYGLQAQIFAADGTIKYGNGLTGEIGKYSDSGKKASENPTNTFTVIPSDDAWRLTACMDTWTIPEGFEDVQYNVPSIYTEAYGKAYFNLINGRGGDLSAGESIQWSGFYIFE